MTEPEFFADRILLHLSDIHFRKGRMGDAHDADADLRNELERDLRTIRAERLWRIDGIIVSGGTSLTEVSRRSSISQVAGSKEFESLWTVPKTRSW